MALQETSKLENKNKRQVACKIPLRLIHQGEYIIEKEQEPNYLKIGEEERIYRVNVIAVIINKEKIGMITNLLLDDGTDKIVARLFEESKAIRTGEVGDVIQMIGRIRLYNEEKYISPEIIKKIDSLWLKIRKEELKKIGWEKYTQKEVSHPVEQEKPKEKKNKKIREESKEDEREKEQSPQKTKTEPKPPETSDLGLITAVKEELSYEKLVKIIKELDRGQGVFIEEVIEKSPLNNTEQIIQRMLESGDIFQNQPGRVKVL
ncbi:hypothetical protein HYT55_03295 [Candidatus Woesearchaeota archaeon]|nr:hypothetical protein [Candidatus Woesearchaeota archaeon]